MNVRGKGLSEYKKTRGALRVPKSAAALVLGYTRTGKAVVCPAAGPPSDVRSDEWEKGDHKDAAKILAEHSDREPDPSVAKWCHALARLHRRAGR